MNVTATLNNGETVNIIAINVNGHSVYISYVDTLDNLKVYKDFLEPSISGCLIATSATIIS